MYNTLINCPKAYRLFYNFTGLSKDEFLTWLNGFATQPPPRQLGVFIKFLDEKTGIGINAYSKGYDVYINDWELLGFDTEHFLFFQYDGDIYHARVRDNDKGIFNNYITAVESAINLIETWR